MTFIKLNCLNRLYSRAMMSWSKWNVQLVIVNRTRAGQVRGNNRRLILMRGPSFLCASVVGITFLLPIEFRQKGWEVAVSLRELSAYSVSQEPPHPAPLPPSHPSCLFPLDNNESAALYFQRNHFLRGADLRTHRSLSTSFVPSIIRNSCPGGSCFGKGKFLVKINDEKYSFSEIS